MQNSETTLFAGRRKTNSIHLKNGRYWYLDVAVVFTDEEPINFNAKTLKIQIIKSLKEIFGEAGAATTVDILKYSSASQRAILRCPADKYVKLRSALTLTSNCSEYKCLFKIHKASASLMSLATNSRTFEHK